LLLVLLLVLLLPPLLLLVLLLPPLPALLELVWPPLAEDEPPLPAPLDDVDSELLLEQAPHRSASASATVPKFLP
jgi:hypothetical protein